MTSSILDVLLLVALAGTSGAVLLMYRRLKRFDALQSVAAVAFNNAAVALDRAREAMRNLHDEGGDIAVTLATRLNEARMVMNDIDDRAIQALRIELVPSSPPLFAATTTAGANADEAQARTIETRARAVTAVAARVDGESVGPVAASDQASEEPRSAMVTPMQSRYDPVEPPAVTAASVPAAVTAASVPPAVTAASVRPAVTAASVPPVAPLAPAPAAMEAPPVATSPRPTARAWATKPGARSTSSERASIGMRAAAARAVAVYPATALAVSAAPAELAAAAPLPAPSPLPPRAGSPTPIRAPSPRPPRGGDPQPTLHRAAAYARTARPAPKASAGHVAAEPSEPTFGSRGLTLADLARAARGADLARAARGADLAQA